MNTTQKTTINDNTSLLRYIILFDGCDTEDIEYTDRLFMALQKLDALGKREELQSSNPRIEIYKRNEKGEYLNIYEDIYPNEINMEALREWEPFLDENENRV